MATLYEITKEIEFFDFEIDEETGEILNAMQLDELEMARDEKVENCCLFIKNLLSDAEAYKREKESFAEKQRRAERKAESLKNYVQYCLNGEKYKSDRVTVSYRKSESVDISDADRIPEEYVRTITEIKPDKKLIKEAIKRGEKIDGADLVEKQNMIIK